MNKKRKTRKLESISPLTESSSSFTYPANKKRKTRKRESISPLTENFSARTRSDYKNTSSLTYPRDDVPSPLSPFTSSYGYYRKNEISTETDPGEFNENWKIRDKDKYDSDETYLSSIGSKHTSRRRKFR